MEKIFLFSPPGSHSRLVTILVTAPIVAGTGEECQEQTPEFMDNIVL